MKGKEYTKINLRDFRHNLTQLKDSIEAGMIYQITEKGSPLAYFIPVQYDIDVKTSKKGLHRKLLLKHSIVKKENLIYQKMKTTRKDTENYLKKSI